ncbi:MAG: SH3 domain-containing protein [Chloroflexi bacterium]|nr:SH3 domain-containing protein [Chloroflexota bacterium]
MTEVGKIIFNRGLRHRLVIFTLAAVLLAAGFGPASATAAGPRFQYFSATGHNVAHPFLEFFETRGGIDIFGYPRTEQIWEGGRLVQYFQRHRLEWHPENSLPYRVQLMLIGDVVLGPGDPPVTSTAGIAGPPRRYFSKTGHTLSHEFAAFFDRHGGLEMFGYPTSEPYVEDGLLVQRFQRAKLELHPENLEPWRIQLALLGDHYIYRMGMVPLELTRPVSPLYSDGDRSSVRARRGDAIVRAAPSASASQITELYYDAKLPALNQRHDEEGNLWLRTQVWGSIEGWIRAAQVIPDTGLTIAALGRRPQPDPVLSPTLVRAQISRPLSASGLTRGDPNVRQRPSLGAPIIGTLGPGDRFEVRAWAGDAAGGIWYRIDAGGIEGWVYAALTQLQFPDPTTVAEEGEPIWQSVSGKGMWTFYDVLVYSDPIYLIAAARATGISHLYVEAPANASGVVERRGLDALLPAAHASGLKVVGWVMPRLSDVHDDVLTAVAVAEYVTPTGHRFDGVALDVEWNIVSTGADTVGAYAQTIRAMVGNGRLLVGVTYPPTSSYGPGYPYRTLARYVNAFAPMGYWHDRPRDYRYAEVYDYVTENVRLLRQITGKPRLPVSFIGQTYDHFARNGIGPMSPTSEEIEACLRAARDTGAIGVSFYQWPTATPEEWGAIRNFDW